MVGENEACALLPPLLLHAKDVPALAVSVADVPLQIATVAGEMAAVGLATTVTATGTLAEPQLFDILCT